MDIQIELEKGDWRSFQKYIEKKLLSEKKSWINGFWVNSFLWMGIGAGFMYIFQQYSDFHWPTATSVLIIGLLIFAKFIFELLAGKRAFEPSSEGTFCGEHTFTFNEEEVRASGEGYTQQHSWSIVKKIERVNGMILVYLDTAYAYVFPEEKLEHPEEFYAYISDQHSKCNKAKQAGTR